MEILERTDQLGQLHDYLRQADAGEGKLVLLGGEAGIGKSTLIERFVRESPAVVRGVRTEVVS
jgi:predicted ATPase